MTALLLHADAGWLGGRTLERSVTVLVTEDRTVWRPPPESIPAQARHIQLDGVLTPGLVDHHVHVELIDLPDVLAGGICEVRDLGAAPARIFPLAAFSNRSAHVPRVRSTGPFLTAPGGYPTDRSWATEAMCQPVERPDEAAAVVRRLAAMGADAIKVALHSEAGPVPDDQVTRAIVEAAHAVGLAVIAHAEGAGQAERALAAGVDELAHAPFSHRLDDEVIAAFAARTRWVSTLDIHGRGRDTPQQRVASDNLRRFHAAGGRVRYGTDLGNGPLPTGVNARELAALVAAGLPAIDVLRSIATSATDLAVLDADPLADPVAISQVSAIVRACTYLPAASPRKITW